MPLTRAQDEEILEYLLSDVLRVDEGHSISRVFEVLEIGDLTDLVATENRDFFNTYYSDDTEDEEREERVLPRSQANRCKHLRNLAAVIISENGSTPDVEGWKTAVTHESFMLYCANPRLPVPSTGLATGLAAPVLAPTAPATSQTASFLRGNKRDISAYPELKDILKFTTWKMQFDALAIKDNVAKVIDANYVPTPNSPEADVFRAQQDFVYAVFTSTLKDPTAKNILASEMRTRNAQKIYRE